MKHIKNSLNIAQIWFHSAFNKWQVSTLNLREVAVCSKKDESWKHFETAKSKLWLNSVQKCVPQAISNTSLKGCFQIQILRSHSSHSSTQNWKIKWLMVLLSFISNSQLATDSSHHEGTLHFLVGQNCPFCWRSEPACELFAELSHFWWFRQMPGVRFVEGFQEAKRARWEYFSLSSWAFTFLL